MRTGQVILNAPYNHSNFADNQDYVIFHREAMARRLLYPSHNHIGKCRCIDCAMLWAESSIKGRCVIRTITVMDPKDGFFRLCKYYLKRSKP